jgi:hypothetical protein
METDMTRHWTVQCGYAAYYSNVVIVEAETIDEALTLAVETANDSSAWKSIDHCGDTFIDAIAEGEDVDPWTDDSRSRLAVPFAHTEAALWSADQPGYVAMRDALLAIVGGRPVASNGDPEIADVTDPVVIARSALAAAGIEAGEVS